MDGKARQKDETRSSNGSESREPEYLPVTNSVLPPRVYRRPGLVSRFLAFRKKTFLTPAPRLHEVPGCFYLHRTRIAASRTRIFCIRSARDPFALKAPSLHRLVGWTVLAPGLSNHLRSGFIAHHAERSTRAGYYVFQTKDDVVFCVPRRRCSPPGKCDLRHMVQQ